MEKRFLAEPLSGCQVPKVWCLSGGELWNERRAGTCGNHPLAGRSSFVISRPRCMEVAELDVGQAALGPGSGCISMVVCDSLLLAGKAGKLREAEGPPGIRAQVSTPTWQSLPQEKRGKAGRLSRATSGIARQVAAIEHVLRHRRLVCQRWPSAMLRALVSVCRRFVRRCGWRRFWQHPGVPSCGCLQL